MQLSLHNEEVASVFDLLGGDENAATFSMGWTLSQSPLFCRCLLKSILGEVDTGKDFKLFLQDHADDGGFTDIEIENEKIHVIIEAKLGLNLPSERQLCRYSPRFEGQKTKLALAVLSGFDASYARVIGQPNRIGSIPVKYMSWQQVHRIALACAKDEGRTGQLFLRQLCDYLEAVMDFQNQDSNVVFVLSLGIENSWPWSKLAPVEYVTKRRRYFHPYGPRWPKNPPNYLGFRYHGQLQSIHHVEQCQLVANLADHLPDIIKTKWNPTDQGPYLLYTLGPAIRPPEDKPVRTGKAIVRSARVWVALDLLLTSKTISDAMKKTKKRKETGSYTLE